MRKIENSKRYNAANISKDYLSKQISKKQWLDGFPEYQNDFELRLLFYLIKNRSRKIFWSKLSMKKYDKDLAEIYELIKELETNKLSFRIMKILLKELRIQSNNCSTPIEGMGIMVFEVSKMARRSKKEIRRYLDVLIENDYLRNISKEPSLYEFLENEKGIIGDSEIENIFKNLA